MNVSTPVYSSCIAYWRADATDSNPWSLAMSFLLMKL